MDGSTLLFILMPIVIIPLLFGWIAMLFYADGHPGRKTQSAASEATEPARRKGGVPIPLPGPAYSRQSPDLASADPAMSLHGEAQRPAA
jgi:hypothetical protein